jgi:hypothetical protein
MPLFPQLSHRIPVQKAREMTARYKAHKKIILKKEYEDKNILSECETFNREAIDSLLAQQGCAGLRIYFSMDDALTVRAILVAVNSNNQDILPAEGTMEASTSSSTKSTSTDTDGIVVEDGRICPPNCPTAPSLNNP